VSLSSTLVTVTAPAHAAGSVGVTVTNPDGLSATLASAFTFAAGVSENFRSVGVGSIGGNPAIAVSSTNGAGQLVLCLASGMAAPRCSGGTNISGWTRVASYNVTGAGYAVIYKATTSGNVSGTVTVSGGGTRQFGQVIVFNGASTTLGTVNRATGTGATVSNSFASVPTGSYIYASGQTEGGAPIISAGTGSVLLGQFRDTGAGNDFWALATTTAGAMTVSGTASAAPDPGYPWLQLAVLVRP
jgi:large repetitive protein